MRRLVSSFAALLLGSAAGVAMSSGPAAAAACAAGTGVTVVVGSSTSCDADGGSPASGNFRDAGHTLTPVDRQPGFVCKVDGAPSSASCVNTPPSNAYWGLFWSDGVSGRWVYSTQGVGSLKVPAGGWVAFVFQDSGSRTAPAVTPVSAAAPTAKPTSKPSSKPTARATSRPTTRPSAKATARPTSRPSSVPTRLPGTVPTGTPTPSGSTPSASSTAASAEPSASASPSTSERQTPSPESTDGVTATSSEQPDDSGSLGWVAGALVVALVGGMGVVLWRRRAAGGPS